MKKIFTRSVVLWIPLTIAITGMFGFAYLATQQNYRQSVNDPQIQMAEDAASSLAANYIPADVVSRGAPLIDMTKSLAPWIVVYDASGLLPLESNGVLDGAPPHLPQGLFDVSTWRGQKIFAAPTGNETRITWQPKDGVRQAVVLVSFPAPHGVGYVAVGRSLRTVEDRIIELTRLATVAWGVTVLASFGAIFLLIAIGWL